MEIILLQDVDKVGERNEIVKVKDGYGRNYLIPKGLALIANDTNRKILAARLRSIEKKETAKIGEYQAIANKVNGQTVKISARAGASGKLFGSVNAATVAEALQAQLGVTIDRKKIVLDDVKELGAYTAKLNLHKEVPASFSVEVVAEEATA
jgi:large subunit ribosomal protein L9